MNRLDALLAAALYLAAPTAAVRAQDSSEFKESKWEWGQAKRVNIDDFLKVDDKESNVRRWHGADTNEEMYVLAYESDGEHHVKHPDSFVDVLLISRLAVKEGKKFFVYGIGDHSDIKFAPGLHRIINKKIDDMRETFVGVQPMHDTRVLTLQNMTVNQHKLWIENKGKLRFCGTSSLRYEDRRRPKLELETTNDALKVAQKLTNEAQYGAARKMLDEAANENENLAVKSIIKGTIELYEKFDEWRNKGAETKVDEVVKNAQDYFTCAKTIDKKYDAVMKRVLYDAGVIVTNGECTNPDADQLTIEGAITWDYIAFENWDVPKIEERKRVSIEALRREGQSADDWEKVDFSKPPEGGKRNLQARLPKLWVMGWQYDIQCTSRKQQIASGKFPVATFGDRGMLEFNMVQSEGKYYITFN